MLDSEMIRGTIGWDSGQMFALQMMLALVLLELELIQTHMTQKPVLRVEVGARALRVLIKKCGWTGRGKCGCARHLCVGVWAWISGAPVRAGWVCDGGGQLFFVVPPVGCANRM